MNVKICWKTHTFLSSFIKLPPKRLVKYLNGSMHITDFIFVYVVDDNIKQKKHNQPNW